MVRLKKPLLDANGNWVLRRDILLDGINCEPELFDVECEMLNAQYHKNQNYDEIKTHHYLISFDPADKDECGLTGERAQAIGMEYVKQIFLAIRHWSVPTWTGITAAAISMYIS